MRATVESLVSRTMLVALLCCAWSQARATEAIVTTLPAALPLRRDGGEAATDGMMLWLLGACALLGAALFYLRRHVRQGSRGSVASPRWARKWLGPDSDDLRIVATKALSSAGRVQVIEWNGMRYLVAHNDQAFALLDRVPAAAGTPSTAPEQAPEMR